ncbi:hypothetical protein FOMPIDRAFT_1056167 [Fomitopsis schrenkii]|uniref:DNA 3'-5' helicase n=1 Tax=Fomitopsis schrenkii TaxID=2126942 RepID=S8DI86_FOMSC|nr:hypothetical protein FOMPIDRAFT_1056167 [Fomitopsis schrenkii]
MHRFREGGIDILGATEAAGMGLDISDIRRVIQFQVPKSLSQWLQRYGRAGRDGQPAVAIILVQPSVFKVVKAQVKKEAATSATHSNIPRDDTEGDPPPNTIPADPSGSRGGHENSKERYQDDPLSSSDSLSG